MTKISEEDIARLAQLSKLSLTEDEARALQGELSTILEYIETLQKLDIEGVEPTYQVNDLQNVWRKDEVARLKIKREDLLALSNQHKDNQVQVPKVL